ncbi:ribosomal protein S18-alanine N-acetyltransferase [Lichenicoccus sp.]|uniref:ribosomal protein S18-alanine N-acetyltransferase n=1 Tax=Lichenicoccus sp. TaxID=2781899 RepID=UPI003D12EADF
MILQGRAHAELLAALHRASFAAGERWDAAAIAALLAMPGCFAALAPDREPCGMAIVRVASDEAELLTLAVLPACRRQRLAAGLLDAVTRHAAAAGAKQMFLEVAETNIAASALYHRVGFAAVGRRPRYYAEGTDAILMSRALGLSPCELRSA